MTVIVEVPFLPPHESSPNWRGHWPERYIASQTFKNAVYFKCVAERNKLMEELGDWVPFFKPTLELTFVFPNRRRRDEDNLRASFKPGLDGIVAAGLIRDDSIGNLTLGKIKIVIDRTRAPLTIIELKEEI